MIHPPTRTQPSLSFPSQLIADPVSFPSEQQCEENIAAQNMQLSPCAHPKWGPTARSGQLSDSGSDADEAGATLGRDTAHHTNSILQSYLDVYTDAEKCDAAFEEGLRRVREHLLSGQRGAAVCLICLEGVRRTDSVWACQRSCSCTFHLLCIQAWARQQAQAAARKALEHDQHEVGKPPALPVWCCPKCRCEYRPEEAPTQYRCFCGKHRDPAEDPWLAPHTCGETCGRPLACGHACVLLCHPGPCPPCPRLVEASCHCAKQRTQRRCQASSFSCTKLCGKQKACSHRCALRCHTGDCQPCQLTSSRTCQCGAATAAVACSVTLFQCDRVCGGTLRCGRHQCEQCCHAGECGGCPEEGVRHCPCGKATFTEIQCDEPTPVCGDTCGKLLACGSHTCAERCHVGPCPALCRALVSKTCHCGCLQKELPCCELLRCERRCPKTRSCGRHPCKRRCCNGCPPCQEVCGRVLKCGNHRCPATCHEGSCLPCPLEFSVACACGGTSYRLPCGWEARAVPPRCMLQCAVTPTCRHAAQLPPHRRAHHACHYGPCPPCPHSCATLLVCGHSCPSLTCHDTRTPMTPPFLLPPAPFSPAYASVRPYSVRLKGGGAVDAQPPAQEAAAAAAALLEGEIAQQPCPPCRQPISLPCLGAHTQLQQPCCEAASASCGEVCGRLLPCGSHFLSGTHSCCLECHTVSAAGDAAGPECESCTLRCGRDRSCGHACEERCHAAACQPCALLVVQPCHCGKSSISLECHTLHSGIEELQTAVNNQRCCGKACHRPLSVCPHPCEAGCHLGPCATVGVCSAQVTVRCACKRRKEKQLCSDVQAMLAKQTGGSGAYDSATALRLLPCDAVCKAAQALISVAKAATPEPEVKSESNASAARNSSHTASASGGRVRKRLNKEDRLREKAAEDAQAVKGRSLRCMVAWVLNWWIPVLMVLLGLLTAVYLERALAF